MDRTTTAGTNDRPRRPLHVYVPLVVLVVLLGLASRRYRDALPQFVGAYAGDTLWANMVFWLFAIVLRRWRTAAVAAAALAFAFAIEASQLYHAPWIDGIRATRIGALILGSDFVWSDLLCYASGIAAAGTLDWLLVSKGTQAEVHAAR